MGNIISITKIIEHKKQQQGERINQEFRSLTKTVNQHTSRRKRLDCDGSYDAD
jgi:hypothetical protein